MGARPSAADLAGVVRLCGGGRGAGAGTSARGLVSGDEAGRVAALYRAVHDSTYEDLQDEKDFEGRTGRDSRLKSSTPSGPSFEVLLVQRNNVRGVVHASK